MAICNTIRFPGFAHGTSAEKSEYVRTVTDFGDRLLAQALRDCHEAVRTFAFVGVILDCVDERAKRFYQRWDFLELPGNPYRLFLPVQSLAAMMGS